jgi:hypothetical protein
MNYDHPSDNLPHAEERHEKDYYICSRLAPTPHLAGFFIDIGRDLSVFAGQPGANNIH